MASKGVIDEPLFLEYFPEAICNEKEGKVWKNIKSTGPGIPEVREEAFLIDNALEKAFA